MKQFVTTCCVACLCLTMHAQISVENYPIDEYLFPDIDRRTLGVDFNFSGSYNRQNAFGVQFSNLVTSSQLLDAVWTHFINTREKQVIHSAFGGLSGAFLWNENGPNVFRVRPLGGASFTTRNYDGNDFFEWGFDVSANYGYERERIDETPAETDKLSTLAAQFSVDIKKGKGRLEPIDDLVLALYTLQDLQDAGLVVPAELDSLGITRFADEMAVVRNDRVFDFRRFRMHQLESLFRYMDEQGWISDCSNPAYFSILNDNWQYAFRNVRQSGKRHSFGITPNLIANLSRSTNITGDEESYSTQNSIAWGVQATYDFDKERVMSLYQQRMRSHRILLGYGWDQLVFKSDDPFNDEALTNAVALTTLNTISWGYYPNSRTALEYGVQADLLIGWDFDDLITTVQTGVFASASYFLSYRTRLNFDVSAFLTEGDDRVPLSLAPPGTGNQISSGIFRASVRLSLTHDIF